MKFRIQQLGDEGSLEPFIARIWFGTCDLRDTALNFAGIDLQPGRMLFDDAFKPILDSLIAMRTSSKNIGTAVAEHCRKANTGELFAFQRNAVEITESINPSLRQDFALFVNSGVRATKGMQYLLEKFKIDIGFLFQKKENYLKGLKKVAVKDAVLAEYLAAVRESWSEAFLERRNALEHHGWQLPNLEYEFSNEVGRVIEPVVEDIPVTQYTMTTSNLINAFVEDLVVYAFSTILPPPIIVTEIPEPERDQALPVRFEITMAGFGKPKWSLKYSNAGFHHLSVLNKISTS